MLILEVKINVNHSSMLNNKSYSHKDLGIYKLPIAMLLVDNVVMCVKQKWFLWNGLLVAVNAFYSSHTFNKMKSHSLLLLLSLLFSLLNLFPP